MKTMRYKLSVFYTTIFCVVALLSFSPLFVSASPAPKGDGVLNLDVESGAPPGGAPPAAPIIIRTPIENAPTAPPEQIDASRITQGQDARRVTIAVFLNRLIGILNAIVPFIIGLAFLVVLWGIFIYLAKAGDEKKRAEAKKFILYGVIGLFCMLSIWGFVGILVRTFEIGGQIDASQIPKVPRIEPTN